MIRPVADLPIALRDAGERKSIKRLGICILAYTSTYVISMFVRIEMDAQISTYVN